MSRWRVCDVMTADVVSVPEDAHFREVVELLTKRRISAVPVVDADRRVLGVVSEADLVAKVEFAGGDDPPRLFENRRHRAARDKAAGELARELMTVPAVTVPASSTLVAAARLMESAAVKRLPVVDDVGHLVGVVSRGDLLKVFLRTDDDIRDEIVDDVVSSVAWTDAVPPRVEVDGGVVMLTGEVQRRSSVPYVVTLAARVDGVVDVIDRLTCRIDDTSGHDLDRLLFLHRP